MANVVVRTGRVSCPHEGVATLLALPAKIELVVDNIPTLTMGSTGTVAFTGCTNPGNAGGPCTQIVSWSGASTLLEVGGESVILDSSIPSTDRAPNIGSVDSAGQDKLEAGS